MSVAEVNLKLIWDVVSQIKIGERGVAYLLDAQSRVIVHPNTGLVQRDFSSLAQVQAARAASTAAAQELPQQLQPVKDINGREVLAAYAPVPVTPLGWLVFVELPAEEANAPAQ